MQKSKRFLVGAPLLALVFLITNPAFASFQSDDWVRPAPRNQVAKVDVGQLKGSKRVAARRAAYQKMIKSAAKKHGVPIKVAQAVVQVESNFNPKARGGAGEIGLMQIKPATARGLGFRGNSRSLYDPQTNLEWGMKYLAGAHKLANGDVCGTILRYNAGHYARRMNPISARYCRKVQRIIASS
ncbi:MAG: transglycosylase SLT domain-containing protein [Rhodobacteraceae bacterium]|nr:transglycosylase SLT domain-containing protein [Paracoccaceae bacterium]